MTMTRVKNLSDRPQQFHLKNGEDAVLRPGEEKSLNLAKPDSAHNAGRAHAGLVEIGSGSGKVAEKARSAPVPAKGGE